ncbi:hypothetical protein C0V72_09350 [Porphyrobacter sp. TH134]|uniref:hypothetical protein n=1 Tax=Porphyrobacter sp. TH134 TaxID=2067450 RepID=UPI000C7C1E36|nr:hypothetical protein [Porphyrobacter sp. TH134]PLK23477.1 hypothetical protein C0V72_09350 [Porphyrobacter sp. TH134]
MREQDKPFVMVRRGPWNFTIMPRGKAGWAQFAAWMVVFAVPTVAFAIVAESLEGRPEFWAALAAYLAAVLVWSFASIRWMKARAEVIDVEALLRQKRAHDRKQRR